VFLDQTYCQNQDNSQRCYNKKGNKNIKIQPTTRLSLNALGVQAINGKSFVSFLDNTKTFEMMKFMVTITIQNIENEELKSKLERIIYNEDLELDKILNTVNIEENYKELLLALEMLSGKSNTFKKLFERLMKNPLNFKTKSNQVLENLQKAMLLSYFMDKNLQHQLIMEKPIAVILDNYSVHHAIVFTELCNILNMDLIHLPPYSPKYNPIEQVWRTIKAKISRKFITSIEQLKFIFENEFKQVIDNESYWKNWLWKFL
jgi:transposase